MPWRKGQHPYLGCEGQKIVAGWGVGAAEGEWLGAGGVSDAAGAGLFANGDGCGRVMGCAFGCGSNIGWNFAV